MSRELIGRVSSQNMNREDISSITRRINTTLKQLGMNIKIFPPNGPFDTGGHSTNCPPTKPSQCDHRHGTGPYKILIRGAAGREPFCFTMWDSYYNASKGYTDLLTNYSVIKMLCDCTADEHYPNYTAFINAGIIADNTFARKLFRGHTSFKKKIKDWFTETELTTLRGTL